MNCLCKYCGCTRRAGYKFYKSFPKRILVAVSVLVILLTCVMPSDARSIEPRRRHPRHEARNKDFTNEMLRHRRRHDSSRRQSTKEFTNDPYKIELRKVTSKLRNTRRFFNQDRRKLMDIKEYRDGMPSWLPSVNFVKMHFHEYPRTNGTTIPESKFKYLIPRLYNALKTYEEIFELLLNVRVFVPDVQFTTYKMTRDKLINDNLGRLRSTLSEIDYSRAVVHLPSLQFNSNAVKTKLVDLRQKVDATQCLKNDYIAFRGYANLLNNWTLELICNKNKTNTECDKFNRKIIFKKHKRHLNKGHKKLAS